MQFQCYILAFKSVVKLIQSTFFDVEINPGSIQVIFTLEVLSRVGRGRGGGGARN